ncbi:MAG: 1,4-dihydroxy-2-naphthoate polyprenyltransferase [Chloroflexi bacterium HGW-Chloroflexi-6]|nr:MAG: 1,4-dihydroxy-2-naphthoate polyprenyltransferase [Chloroflexi bacterium HGW-Chloroflexi-6]
MQNRPSKLSAWILAARPRTLPAAAAPVLVGTGLALRAGQFDAINAAAAFFIAILLQIGANLANDLFDHERGTDTPDRLGPARATSQGWISPGEMRLGIGLVFGLAALLGLVLYLDKGWPVLAIGLAAILAALAYTGGPFPYGYHALGDVFVFVFFGLAAVAGTYFVQAGEVTLVVWLASIPMGLLIVNILVVNNLRDIPTDTAAKKRTLAVLLGQRAMEIEYLLCLFGAYLVPLLMVVSGLLSTWVLLTWLTLPQGWFLYRLLQKAQGTALNVALAYTAQLSLVYAALFAAGSLFK